MMYMFYFVYEERIWEVCMHIQSKISELSICEIIFPTSEYIEHTFFMDSILAFVAWCIWEKIIISANVTIYFVQNGNNSYIEYEEENWMKHTEFIKLL